MHVQPPMTLQPKLAVSSAEDASEKEADEISEYVAHMPEPPLPLLDTQVRSRASQEKADVPGRMAAPPIIDQVLASAGQPVDPATRAFMEPRFGHDFSQVRVHTDATAAQSAHAVDALSYTVGHHVVFDGGRFTPGTHDGRRLLAHELTHVVQQGGQGGFVKPGPTVLARQSGPSARNPTADLDEDARNSHLGHSPAWQQAYLAAGPEDSTQRDLVTQLALPIEERQTREQARRVEALQAQIRLMDPGNAQRLYIRLTDPADALGILFHLTLHHVTVKSLLAQLDAKRQESHPVTAPAHRGMAPVHRGPAPVHQGTDNRQVPHLRPVPPQYEPEQPKQPQDHQHITDTGVPVSPYPVPPPWMNDDQQVDPDGSGSQSWIWSSLKAAAGMLGMTYSVGLRAVSTVAMEKALEAAWLVFQITDAAPAALMGMAGEAAAEAFLAEIMGVDPASVRNLNQLKESFPLVDLISPRWIGSVKTRGALSTLPPSALTEQLRSQYTSDLLQVITGEEKVESAAEALLRFRPELGRAWPSDLRATTIEGVSKYLREKTVLLVPSDHVQPLRRTLGADLYRRIKDNNKWLDQLGIKSGRQLAKFVSEQTSRIQSLGPSSADFRLMAETAARHLPSEVNEKFRKKFAAILRKSARRVGK